MVVVKGALSGARDCRNPSISATSEEMGHCDPGSLEIPSAARQNLASAATRIDRTI